jgi:hypothetical protein
MKSSKKLHKIMENNMIIIVIVAASPVVRHNFCDPQSGLKY